MRTQAERGIYGRWLTDVREARGYKTAAEARKALADAGVTISHSTYAEYESGTKVPSRNHLPLLERFWGPVYDPAPATAPADAAVLAALTANTEAVNALVARLDTFVGPLGEVVADLLRERVRAATDRTRSGAPTS